MAISPQQIAIAAEALNRAPGLSPLARRVGWELINRTDRKTGLCRPSEARLALSLGCDERSVRRAKKELQGAGFLAWVNPGHHKRSVYRIMWTRLCEVAAKLKRKIREQADPAIAKARHMRAVKWRRWLNSTRTAHETDRTKMSYNPTTHIKSININTETKDAALEAKASQRFWRDLGNLPDTLSEKISNELTETVLCKALEGERRLWGTGIQIAADLIQGRHPNTQGGANA